MRRIRTGGAWPTINHKDVWQRVRIQHIVDVGVVRAGRDGQEGGLQCLTA